MFRKIHQKLFIYDPLDSKSVGWEEDIVEEEQRCWGLADSMSLVGEARHVHRRGPIYGQLEMIADSFRPLINVPLSSPTFDLHAINLSLETAVLASVNTGIPCF